MSRLRNFPEMLYVGMSKKNNLLVFDKPVADALLAIGERIATYKIVALPKTVPYDLRRKAPKPVQTPATQPPGPDNQPQTRPEALPTATKAESKHKKWVCDDCGLEFDKPFITGSGISCCPQCKFGNFRRLNPRPKRHRRTRAEMGTPGAGTPLFHCNACGKDVENPITSNMGKVQCPHCLVVGKVVGKDD